MITKGFVCYCPELDLYHYRVSTNESPDGDIEHEKVQVDMKFTTFELELAMAAHLDKGNEKEAQFMANISGLARAEPHFRIDLIGDDATT